MRIKAAIYRPDWSPRSLVETSDILQLNAALRLGETWREVPAAAIGSSTRWPDHGQAS